MLIQNLILNTRTLTEGSNINYERFYIILMCTSAVQTQRSLTEGGGGNKNKLVPPLILGYKNLISHP